MRRGQLAVEYIIVMAIVVVAIAVIVIFFKQAFVERMSSNIGATTTGYGKYLEAGGVGEVNVTAAETQEKSIFEGGVQVLGEASFQVAGFIGERIYEYRWVVIGVVLVFALGYAAYRATRSYS